MNRESIRDIAAVITILTFLGGGVYINNQFTETNNQFTKTNNQFTEIKKQFTEIKKQFTEINNQFTEINIKVDKTIKIINQIVDKETLSDIKSAHNKTLGDIKTEHGTTLGDIKAKHNTTLGDIKLKHNNVNGQKNCQPDSNEEKTNCKEEFDLMVKEHNKKSENQWKNIKECLKSPENIDRCIKDLEKSQQGAQSGATESTAGNCNTKKSEEAWNDTKDLGQWLEAHDEENRECQAEILKEIRVSYGQHTH